MESFITMIMKDSMATDQQPKLQFLQICFWFNIQNKKILSLTNTPAFTPNGVYWQPSTDLKNEGYFVNDPDVPNDRESLFLDYNNDFAVAVSIAAGDQMSPGVDFINIFTNSFYARSSPKRKNSVKLSSIFLRFWDLHS